LAAALLAGCQFVTPGANPTQGPNLTATSFDWNSRSTTDFTGPRRTPDPGFPWNYAGLWKDPGETTNFNSTITMGANDPTGVKSLTVTYNFYTCGDVNGNPVLQPLTSFNGGATTGQSSFTLNATPGPPNNNQAPTRLAYPIRITTQDLQTVDCGNGKKSSGLGTIYITVSASNFSANPAVNSTRGEFDIQIDNSPLPNM